MIGTYLIYFLMFSADVLSLCPPETECFGHGHYNRTAQTCNCSPSIKEIGPFTGECCESIGCKSNATCKHGFCDSDGITCAKCQPGWSGDNCTEVTSCFPWFPCVHGSCNKSRSLCECEPGWVGDQCDRTVCLVPCKLTNDHVVQNPPCWRASSLLFPHWDIKTKASQASLVQVSLF